MSPSSEADAFDPLRQAPEADALEQRQAVDDSGHDPTSLTVPAEANPADVLEQHQAVPLGEEDYDR